MGKMKVAFVGEAFGEYEEKYGKGLGLVGPTGIELFKQLELAGMLSLSRDAEGFFREFWDTRDPQYVDLVWNMYPDLTRFNVLNFRPPGNRLEEICVHEKKDGIKGYPPIMRHPKVMYLPQDYSFHLEKLANDLITADPNIVVALGNTASWALLGQVAISKNRGVTYLSTHTATGFKVLPTYHPAAIMRQWELRPVAVMDLYKASREMEFPDIRRPKRLIWLEPTVEDIHEFKERYIDNAALLSVDIETAGSQITNIGFAPSSSLAINIPFVDHRKPGRNYWPTKSDEIRAWQVVKAICRNPNPPKLFQNGLYDITFLARAYGIKVFGAAEDTMLLHHAMHPESLKSLGFLASLYCSEMAWKNMRLRGKTTIKKDD